MFLEWLAVHACLITCFLVFMPELFFASFIHNISWTNDWWKCCSVLGLVILLAVVWQELSVRLWITYHKTFIHQVVFRRATETLCAVYSHSSSCRLQTSVFTDFVAVCFSVRGNKSLCHMDSASWNKNTSVGKNPLARRFSCNGCPWLWNVYCPILFYKGEHKLGKRQEQRRS